MALSEDEELELLELEEAEYQAKKAKAASAKPEITELESLGRGALQNASLGFSDEITGGIEALWEAAKGDPRTFGELYEQFRDESRANNENAQKANPKSYMAGQIAGAIAAAAVPGTLAARGALGAGRVAQAASALNSTAGLIGQGAAQGLGESKADNLGGMARDAGAGAGAGLLALGAGKALGAAGAEVSPYVQKAFNKVGDFADNVAESRAYKAIDPTGSQLRGISAAADDATARNVGRVALEEGIISDGLGSFPKTLTSLLSDSPSISAMQNTAKNSMSRVHGELNDFVADSAGTSLKKSSLLSGLDDVVSSMNKPVKSDSYVRSLIEKMDNNISLEDAINLRKEIGDLVKWDSNIQTAEEKLAEKAYHSLNNLLDTYFPGYKPIRAEEEIMNKIKYGLRNSKSSEAITKGDFITGAFGLGAGGPIGAGVGLAGKKMLSIHGNQMAAVGANKISEIVKKTPQALGKFAPTLQQALQRGTLPAVHHMLQQSNPEYRQLTLGNEDNGQ